VRLLRFSLCFLATLVLVPMAAVGQEEETKSTLEAEAQEAFDNKDCDTLLTLIDWTRNDLITDKGALYISLMLENVCFETNYHEAIVLMETRLAEHEDDIFAARLGDLYLKGLGTTKNVEKANALFLRAALKRSLTNFNLIQTLKKDPNTYDFYPNFNPIPDWTYKYAGLMFWEPPQELITITQKFIHIPDAPNSGEQVFSIGRHLANGTAGYTKNHKFAIEWMDLSFRYFNYRENLVEAVSWAHDPKKVEERRDVLSFDWSGVTVTLDVIDGFSWLGYLIEVEKINPPLLRYAYCLQSEMLAPDNDLLFVADHYSIGSALNNSAYAISQIELEKIKQLYVARDKQREFYPSSDPEGHLDWYTNLRLKEKKFYVASDISHPLQNTKSCWPYFEAYLKARP